MRVAVTGATGFIGRYIVRHLADTGHQLRCWRRQSSNTEGFEGIDLQWITGELGNADSCRELVQGCDAVVHAALYRPGPDFRGGEGNIVQFVRTNVLGTLELIEAARAAGVGRFVFISTCAVHEKILDDRPLDETHPLWPASHYGAHKAAIEKFVHSYALSEGCEICALRPTGVYGVAEPIEQSKWYDLVAAIAQGESVECSAGGKEVHAADVAKAAGILLSADGVSGEAYNCYDRYVSQYDVAMMAKELSGSASQVAGGPKQPKNQIVTDKIRSLGMEFGGTSLLKETIAALVDHAQR